MSENTDTNTEQQQPNEANETDSGQPLGEPGLKALHAERDARKAVEQQLAEANAKLKEIEDANLSELERAQQAAADAAAERDRLLLAQTRSTVALQKGLPADLAQFLTGETEEELNTQADTLLERLDVRRTPRPDPTQGARGTDTTNMTTADQFAAWFKSNS